MPTREEKIAQIEAALRARFFPNVPMIMKPDRAGWNEGQHDLDRLSRSLAAYALVGQCELDDTTAAGTITDGSDDGGIDALYFDRVGNRLVLGTIEIQANWCCADAGRSPQDDQWDQGAPGARI